MKTTKLFFALIATFYALTVSAYDAEIDGIYYNFDGSEAGVTGNPGKYSGDVVIPKSVTYEGKTYIVTSIDGSAFKGCGNLTSITIPETVTNMGYECFYGCSNLTTATIGSSESDIASFIIGGRAFYCCSKLDSVSIGNNVKAIERDAFYGCTSLVSIYIPNSVTSIGSHSFLGCSSLTTVKFPDSIKSIEWATFHSCTSLDSITIPATVENIGDAAFEGCTSLTSITLPANLKKLGWTVFLNCTSLTSISIPDEVTTIYLGTFENCQSLTDVTLGRSIKDLNQGSFAYCPQLKNVYCYAENPPTCHSEYSGYYGGSIGAFEQSITEQTTLYVPQTSISSYQTASTWKTFKSIVAIPDNTYTLTYVLDGEIYKSYEIACGDAIIPEAVPYKRGMTFSGWGEVPEIMPAHDVTLTGSYSWSIDNVNSVIYQVADTLRNEASVIGNDNLSGEANILSSVEIGGDNYTVTAINNAFSNCAGMIAVIIPNSIESISPNAFKGCSGLVSVELHCRVIPDCFKGLKGLKKVMMSDGVNIVGDNAFNGCSAITTIEIGENVGEIGERAFANIDNLTDVICRAESVPQTSRTAFENSYIDYVTLHVPALSIKDYKQAALWKGFKEFVVIPGTEKTFNLTYLVDEELYKTYEVNVWDKIIPEPPLQKEGYTFSGWSEIPDEMPPHDVIVTGSFSVNSYLLTYTVDDEIYKSSSVAYGTAIIPEAEPTKEGYSFSGWSEIPATMPAHDVTVTGSFTKEILGKCATPTIIYNNGELTFNCETEGVTFNYDITNNDIKSGNSNKVQLSVTYHISVRAIKEGYDDSNVATGTLCWIEQQPATENITDEDAVTEVKAIPVLIQSQGGNITIQGATEGTPIAVYDIGGKQYGSTIAGKDRTNIATSLQSGSVAIVKIGEKAIKVLLK